MPAKLPHYLTVSRHGIYYLRVTRNGKESRCSSGTRDPVAARAAACVFGAEISAIMTKKADELIVIALAGRCLTFDVNLEAPRLRG